MLRCELKTRLCLEAVVQVQTCEVDTKMPDEIISDTSKIELAAHSKMATLVAIMKNPSSANDVHMPTKGKLLKNSIGMGAGGGVSGEVGLVGCGGGGGGGGGGSPLNTLKTPRVNVWFQCTCTWGGSGGGGDVGTGGVGADGVGANVGDQSFFMVM